ncbi:MAG: hypothetical protein HOQ11_08045, partial [Gemmatimonadaceae bacterium]|nr:hypothetical protein [Gemmatimonadaceae bacterium]
MRRIAPLLAASALVLVAGAARAQTTAPARATRAATASPVPDIPYTKYT